jgi:hypothetical protein
MANVAAEATRFLFQISAPRTGGEECAAKRLDLLLCRRGDRVCVRKCAPLDKSHLAVEWRRLLLWWRRSSRAAGSAV